MNVTKHDTQQESSYPVMFFFYFYLFCCMCNVISRRKNPTQSNQSSTVYTFTTFNDPLSNTHEITKFSSIHDIIGLNTVKEDIRYYINFIDHREKYLKWNVKLPKGILLAGPPGTGKTMLVKTLAAEINIPVITACASEFVEVYVGVGASRVRDLFNAARKYPKCIIFIDELDAIGAKRGISNNSERDSTLNQLLVEIDGFKDTENIIVFAATNFEEQLDQALTRSGRFDKKVYFDPPNPTERELLFKKYLGDARLPRSTSITHLSKRTTGLTGADIANICNLAKINCLKENDDARKIKEQHILAALDEVMIGREKKERTLTSVELTRVAYHEAGHAFMGYVLQYCACPLQVSIVPRGAGALGFSQPEPTEKKLHTRSMILAEIAVLLAGRAAEQIFCKDISTGAHDDISKISKLMNAYVGVWGMSECIGPLNTDHMPNLVANSTRTRAFDLCKKIVDTIDACVTDLLQKNSSVIEKVAMELLNSETINQKKIHLLIPNHIKDSYLVTKDGQLELI